MKRIDEKAKKKAKQIRSIALVNGPLVFLLAIVSFAFGVAQTSESARVLEGMFLMLAGIVGMLISGFVFIQALRNR